MIDVVKEVTNEIVSGSMVANLAKDLNVPEKEQIKNDLETTLQLILAPILELKEKVELNPEISQKVLEKLRKL